MAHTITWKNPWIPLSKNNANGGHTTKNIKFIIVGGTQTFGICPCASFSTAFLTDVPEFTDENIPPNVDFIANVTPNIRSFINLLGANISGAIFEEANLSNATWVDGKKCALGSISTCQ